jgi:solute:Na+ symporter, SSS family
MLPNNESVANLQYILFALFGGTVTSFFLLGFLTKRVNYVSTMVALAVSIVVNLYLLFNSLGWLPESLQTPVHEYWVNILVNFCFIVVAYGLSAIWSRQRKDISGLTVWSIDNNAL